MWQALLGFDLPLWAKFLFAFAVLLALFSALFYPARRFGGGALGGPTGMRGRQPRLAVIDAATVDTRRKLVLIRRDNVEHLIMIGGPTDVVIEPNIVRATPAPSVRDAAPAREAPVRETPPIRETPSMREAPPMREAALARVTPSLPDPPPRAMPLADGGHWPLQPEAPVRAQRAAPPPPPGPPPPKAAEPDLEEHEADKSAHEETVEDAEPAPRAEPPRVRTEPAMRTEPALRAESPIRAEPMLRAVPDLEPVQRQERQERQERSERPQRAARPQNADRLSGLATDLSRSFMDLDADLSSASPAVPPSPPAPPSPPRRAPEARRPAPPPVQPVASVQPLSEAEEQNLTEMAQRLESALQRPRPAQEPMNAPTPAAPAPAVAPPAAPPALRAVELPRIEPVRVDMKPPRPEPMAAPMAAPTATKPAVRPAPAPAAAKPAFGTLEQEMASLLGRSSSGKT
jgi:hypothetical protein